MAKEKKTAALTVEERLAQALVPEAEQPYPVPENWCWTRVGYLVKLYRGVSYNKDAAHGIKSINDCLVMRGGNVREGSIDTNADNVYVDKTLVSSDQLVKKHDIIIVSSTGSSKIIGRAGISINDYNDVAFGAFLTLARPRDEIIKPFISNYFQSDIYRERIKQMASGVNINNIRGKYITESPLPLPPLTEQQRIVDHIESLFAKLDEVKEKAQAALDSFETRKAAILHKAFTGELTAKWREKNGVEMDSWINFQLGEIFDIVSGIQKTPARTPKNNPVPYLAVANVLRNLIDVSEVKLFEVSSDELCRLRLKKKDILVVEGNGSGNEIGRCAMWNEELPICVHQNHIIRLRLSNESIISEYVLYYLNGDKGKSIMRERAKTTAGLYNLSTGKIKTIRVPFASYPEQTEIVRLLDDFFAREQKAKELCSVLDNIDLIKKSILARAFRGELGTNDPTEESAIELLKTIC